MTKKLLTFLTLLCLSVGVGWATQSVFYELEPKANSSNNNYATYYDVVSNGITWNAPGNQYQDNAWRIGGKKLSGVDRNVKSKTAMGSAISKVELTVGDASDIKVNSLKLIVASDDDFRNQIAEVSATFAANSTITFTPTSGSEWATGAYYKFVFNVTVSDKSSNRFVVFSGAKFYKNDSGSVAAPSISISGTQDNGYLLNSTVTLSQTDNKTIYYTLDGSTPDNTSTPYIAPFALSTGTVSNGKVTVKAIAYDGNDASNVVTEEYTIAQVATPTISASNIKGGKNITLTSTTTGASIFYTLDGTDPTSSSTPYSNAFDITESKTVKAIATKANYLNSDIASQAFAILGANVVFYESFDKSDNSGGRDNTFSGNLGSNMSLTNQSNYADLTWSDISNVYACNKSTRLGISSNNGSMTSPAVGQAIAEATLSFDLAGWKDDEVNTLTITIKGGGTFSNNLASKTITATNGSWQSLSETITNLTAASTITFSGKRFFLDEILLEKVPTLDAPTFSSANVAYTESEGIYQVYKGTTVTITGPEGSTLSYGVNDDDESNFTPTQSNTLTQTIEEDITFLYVKAVKNGVSSSVAEFDFELATPTAPTITPAVNPNSGELTVPAGTQVTISAPAIEGATVKVFGEINEVAFEQNSPYSFTINENTVIMARTKVVVGEYTTANESKATAEYTIASVDAPTISVSPAAVDGAVWKGTQVTLTQENAYEIEYSIDNGQTWLTYSVPFTIQNAVTVKARAYDAEHNVSSEAEATYSLRTVPAPTIMVTPNGNVANVTITGMEGTTIAALDGEDNEYSSQTNILTINNVAVGTYLLATATYTVNGVANVSENAEVTITGVATPTFTPSTGALTGATNVTISCATDGATIYYTTDGSTPTTSSSVYTAAIPVTKNTTIKAIGVKEGMINSDVSSIDYVITVTEPANFGSYVLVKNASDLNDGDKIIIVNSKTNGTGKAISTTQNGNNRGATDVTISNEAIASPSSSVQIITLEATKKNATDTWSFNVGNGYLWAASSTSNYMRTQETLTNDGKALIEIETTGVANIKFQGVNTKNTLLYNTSNTLFSCYAETQTSGVGNVFIYKKQGASATLADIAESPVVNTFYQVSDDYLVVAKYDAGIIYAKDDNGAKAQTASEGMIDYLDQAGLQTAASRDHSNWVAIQIPNTASANYAQGAKITDVKGVLTDAYNMTFIASANPATDGSETFKANVYVPASFQGTQTSTENGKTYFFAKPKANEYVEVQWAVWDAANNQFTTIPKNAQLNHNMAGLQGTVAVASIADGVTLDDGAVYTLEGIVKASAGSSSGAPRRAAAQETLSLEVMSASKTANDVVTGIADMSGISKIVSAVKYYNLMGAESDRPFEGVNIVVTRFSDGSSQTVKVMK